MTYQTKAGKNRGPLLGSQKNRGPLFEASIPEAGKNRGPLSSLGKNRGPLSRLLILAVLLAFTLFGCGMSAYERHRERIRLLEVQYTTCAPEHRPLILERIRQEYEDERERQRNVRSAIRHIFVKH